METNNTITTVGNEKEIDLSELFNILWNGKLLIAVITSLFSIAAVIYSLSLPNIYQSRALLSSVGDSGANGLSQIMKNYGGLASIAGVNLSANDQSANSTKALEKLNTLSFFENNIMPNIFLPDLLAVESWDANSNTIIYDKNIFNIDKKTWIRESKNSENKIPTAQESYNAFMGHLRIFKDIDTGFVTISIKHQSPYIAKVWTELIIDQLNYFYRNKDKIEAEAALDYLNIQMSQTSYAEIKLVIAQILQQKMQQLTLIEASNFYVFEYIDPPAVMETKSEPKRSVLCIVGAFIGAIISFLVVLIRFFLFENKT